MNKSDRDRLENLKQSLSVHLTALNDAYTGKKYLYMSEEAAAIEKITYTIAYLESQIRSESGAPVCAAQWEVTESQFT